MNINPNFILKNQGPDLLGKDVGETRICWIDYSVWSQRWLDDVLGLSWQDDQRLFKVGQMKNLQLNLTSCKAVVEH